MISLCKKEFIQLFRKRTNLAFVILGPIALVLIFSLLMSNYIGNNTNNEKLQGQTVYYIDNTAKTGSYYDQFMNFSGVTAEKTGVVYKESDDFEKCRDSVDHQKALAVITVNEDSYDYYRCEFNENADAKLFRSIFEKTVGNCTDISEYPSIIADTGNIDAAPYYTFAELGFIIIYISAITAYSVYEEREKRTINRIMLSGSGTAGFLFTKFFTGIVMALIQTAVTYIFSSLVLDVDWGSKFLLIILVYLCLGTFSTAFGITVAMTVKKREGIDNIVMFIAILCGYMGGSITPASVLEGKKILKHVIKIDPLYWSNKAAVSLYGGECNSSFAKSVIISLSIAVVLAAVGVIIYKRKSMKGGNLC